MSENLQAYASSGTSRISHANTHMCILLGASGKGTHLNTGPSVARLASINHSHCASRVAQKYVGEEGLSFCHISSSRAVTSDLLTYMAQIHFPWCLPGLHLQNYKEISRHHLCLLWPSTAPDHRASFWLQTLFTICSCWRCPSPALLPCVLPKASVSFGAAGALQKWCLVMEGGCLRGHH